MITAREGRALIGHRQPRRRTGVLRASPWTRAPVLLLRRPAVFLAILGAAAVLALAAASGVLFLSTLGTASLEAQIAQDCPELGMPSFQAYVPPQQLTKVNAEGLDLMRANGALGEPYWVDFAGSIIQATQVTLVSRAGALDHVLLLVGAGWLVGAVLGTAGYAVLVDRLDLYPPLPPGAAFAVPGTVLGLTAATALCVLAIAALLAHLVAERARPAEILRLE